MEATPTDWSDRWYMSNAATDILLSEGSSGLRVESERKGLKGFGGLAREDCSFWKALAYQTVDLLVRAAPPWTARFGIDFLYAGRELELVVSRHLSALVPGSERASDVGGVTLGW